MNILKGTRDLSVPLAALGLNSAGWNYFTSSCPFIDLMHGTNNSWSGTGSASVDSLGWITSMPNGQAVSKYVILHVTYPTSYVRPGRYGITWTGPLTVTINTLGIPQNIVNTDHRVEFDLPLLDQANNRGTFIQVTATNSSGSAASCNDIKVFHLDDEADLLAGEVFQDSFIDVMGGAGVHRWMESQQVNNSTLSAFSSIPTEAHCSWNPCPPSIIGKYALKTDCDAWLSTYPRATQACMDSMFAAVFAGMGASTRRVWAEYSNEDWNFGFTQTGWLRDTKSVGLTIVDANGNSSSSDQSKIACAHAQGSMQTWAAAEASFPRSRVVRVYAGQAASFGALAAGLEYADTSNTLYAGAKVKTLLTENDAYAIGPYFYSTTSGTGSPVPVDMSYKAQLVRKEYLQNDAWWAAVFENSIDTSAAWVAAAKVGIEAKCAAKLVSYELGQHVSFGLGYTQNYTATLTSSRVDFGAVDISAAFDDGEQLSFAFNGGNAPFSGGSPWTGYYVRKDGTTLLKVYSSLANYNTDTPVALNTAFGTWNIDNFTRSILLGERMRSFFDSAAGVAVYQTYYDALLAEGLTNFTHYQACSGYGTLANGGGNLEAQWGLKRSQWEADAHRAAWFRALP